MYVVHSWPTEAEHFKLNVSFFLIQSLPFTTVKHIVTTTDCQPTTANGVTVFVVGQLKVSTELQVTVGHRTMSN